jgi:hypothetical protein
MVLVMKSPHMKLLSVGLMGAVAISACNAGPQEGSYFILCHLALEVHVAPDSATLGAGDSVAAQAHFGMQDGCAPPAPDGPAAWRWTSGDTSVAVVDSIRGVIRSVAVGRAFVRARNATSPFFTDSVFVRVTAPR